MSAAVATVRSPRQDEIAAVSARLFSRRGFRDTSIRDIATALDIKSASLYSHFENKEDILLAIVLGVMEDFVVTVTPVMGDPHQRPEDAIRAVTAAHLRFDFAHLDRVIVSARERRLLPPALQRPVNALRARHRRAVLAMVTSGAVAGGFTVRDPRLATNSLLDLLSGVKEWYHPPRDGSLDSLVATYGDLALSLLGATSDGD